jgi:hypothetical protein
VEAIMRAALVSFSLILCAATPAPAQEVARSFDQVGELIGIGDRLIVTDVSGGEVSGRVSAVSPTRLELTVGDAIRTLGEKDVLSIRQRRGDPIGNGAKIGFGVGAGVGALFGAALAGGLDFDGGSAAGAIITFSLINGGMGALTGACVDALVRGEQIIYSRQTGRSVTLGVAPLSSPGRRGLRVLFTF